MSSTTSLGLPEFPIQSPEHLVRFHEEACQVARQLMKAKNHDYTGGNPDPFQNLRDDGELGVAVRLGDKVRRLRNFFRTQTLRVGEESIEDTCLDVLNYAVLLLALRRDQRRGLPAQNASARWQTHPVENAYYVVHDTLTQGYVPLDEDGYPSVTPGSKSSEWPFLRNQKNSGMITSASELPPNYRVVASMPITSNSRAIQFSRGNPKLETKP